MNLDLNKNQGRAAGTFGCVLCCLVICGTIAFIAYLLLGSKSDLAPRLWRPVVIELNGKQTVLGETRQMEFWTPSAKTKDYLHMDAGVVTINEQWEAIPSDDANVQFGSVLHSNKYVLGYRRVEVWGQGRTNFKPGWWWTVSVLTNCTAGDMATSYHGFWKNQQPVYLEVIDNRGHD